MEKISTDAFKGADANETAFSKEGLLNRNFGKAKQEIQQNEVVEKQQTSSVESGIEKKPLLVSMIEAYTGIVDNPREKALTALFEKLDPNLSDQEKKEQMSLFRKEEEDWNNKQ